VEPNNSRDQATAYALGSSVLGCVGVEDDADYFEFTVPNDAAGGYVQLLLSEVGDGNLAATVYSASDNGQIVNSYATTRGQNVAAFFAVAPDQKFRVSVDDFGGFDKPYRYALKASYTKLEDAFEPNDTREQAKPITLGAPVNAFLFAGHATSNVTDYAFYDFYKLPVTAAQVTVKLENVPLNVTGDLRLFDAEGREVASKYETTGGASVTLTHTVETAGDYSVRVGNFSTLPEVSGRVANVPDHFTRAYKLTTSQP
jgi:hypothetical protein